MMRGALPLLLCAPLLCGAADDDDCAPQCDVSCLRWIDDSPRRACGGCKPQVGDQRYACYPGARGFAPPTPEEEAEIGISALIAGLTVCATLEAAVEVHVRHFHRQQVEERLFVRRLPELCEVPPDAFYTKLHELRRPMMAAINRHVQGAFFVKNACTSASFELTPRALETHVCNSPVLDHEPFNLVEGAYVVNLTNHLLGSGPARFCASTEARPGGLARWTRELEDVMRQHRENRRFDYLWDQFQDQCDDLALAPSPRVFTVNAARPAVDCRPRWPWDAAAAPRGSAPSCAVARAVAPSRQQMDDAIDAEVRSPTSCNCVQDERGACTPATAIDIFGNDTLVLLESARRTVVRAFEKGCSAAANAQRAAAIARLAAFTRGRGDIQPGPDTFYVSVSLGTIYHKLVPFCGQDAVDREGGHLCLGPNDSGNAGGNTAPVLDIVPSTDAARCGAEAAPAAAAAASSYHALLARITTVRTRLLALSFGAQYDGDADHAGNGDAMFSVIAERVGRQCSAELEQLVDDTLALPQVLSEALARLRASVDALALSCVADERRAEVFLAHGTERGVVELVQEAAAVRVARDGGGLKIKVSVGGEKSAAAGRASKAAARDWEPMRSRRYRGAEPSVMVLPGLEVLGKRSLVLGAGFLGFFVACASAERTWSGRRRG